MEPSFLNDLAVNCKDLWRQGEVASYIPELSKAEPSDLALCLCDAQGALYSAGKSEQRFTIQSVSKPLTLALALESLGEEYIFSKVGKEPSGDPFNSYMKLETTKPSRPYNPFINAGAIAIASLLPGKTAQDQERQMLDFFCRITGNPNLSVNEQVYRSESATGHRNWAIGHILKNEGILEGSVEQAMEVYFRQCSVEVSVVDLARAGAVFAQGGRSYEGQTLLSERTAKIVKALMFTCGMYDESGEFAVEVGVPAKSGVGGGIMASVPGRYGIGVYSPALDAKGNSVAGLAILKKLSTALNFSIL